MKGISRQKQDNTKCELCAQAFTLSNLSAQTRMIFVPRRFVARICLPSLTMSGRPSPNLSFVRGLSGERAPGIQGETCVLDL